MVPRYRPCSMTIKCISQQILSGFGGRKAPSRMGRISIAEVPSAALGRGASLPRHAGAGGMTILWGVDGKH
jgi:hypothetical protein